MFGQSHDIVATMPHDLHRKRRAAFANYFSKASVRKLAPLIQSHVDKLCARIERSKAAGEPVPFRKAYSALTADVITGYCFTNSWNHLDAEDYAPGYWKAIDGASRMSHFTKQFPIVMKALQSLPPKLVIAMNPDMHDFFELSIRTERDIADLKRAKKDGKVQEGQRKVIFEELLDSNLPEIEKSDERLAQNSNVLVAAGSNTTLHALVTTTYHLLANPESMIKLVEELEAAIPNPYQVPELVELEQLPYLSAVINEGLRKAYGVPQRLSRISPDVDIRFREWIIPRGVPVGMSAPLIHDNPTIYPEPQKFKPERWLPLETEGQRLQKYLVAFGKGSRSCIAMNLAHAELVLTLATVVRRFGRDMRLWKTDYERDVATTFDGFNALQADPTSEGLSVMITSS